MQINSHGELNENMHENTLDYSKCMFLVKLPKQGYINVNTEFISDGLGIARSGRYHVLYVDAQYGTNTFYVEQKNGLIWTSNHYPPFIDQEFINWIGQQIENYNR